VTSAAGIVAPRFSRRSSHNVGNSNFCIVKSKRVGDGENHVTQREEHRSLYLSYLEYCNKHDLDGMASFYKSTMRVNDVPMDRAAVAAQFPPLFSAFPDWHWEIRNLVVDGDYIAGHFTVTGTHGGPSRELRRPVVG
jgi:predicted ester cyclase